MPRGAYWPGAAWSWRARLRHASLVCMRRAGFLALSVLSLVVLGASAWSLAREARSYLGNSFPSDGERLAAVAGSAAPASFSDEATNALLDGCAWAMTSLYGSLRPTEQRRSIATACGEKAAAVVASRPASAYAVLVGGIAADILGDDQTVSTSIVTSRELAPSAEWLARARVALAARRQASLTESARAAEAADLAIMLRSASGVGVVVTRYVSDPAFRVQVAEILGTLPALDQARFLDLVRQASTERAP